MIFLRMMGLPEGGVGNLLTEVNERMQQLAGMAGCGRHGRLGQL